MRTTIAALFVVSLSAAMAGHGAAQQKSRPEETSPEAIPRPNEAEIQNHLSKGVELFNQKKVHEAFLEFKEALRLKPGAVVCFRAESRYPGEPMKDLQIANAELMDMFSAGMENEAAASERRLKSAELVTRKGFVSNTPPEYPALAKKAHVEGTVRLEALIDKKGAVKKLKLISGHPLLVLAAMKAVSNWRYETFRCHGEGYEVVTEIDVAFHLDN